MKIVAPETLMERVTGARSGCWIWGGARSKEGFGVLRLDDGAAPGAAPVLGDVRGAGS